MKEQVRMNRLRKNMRIFARNVVFCAVTFFCILLIAGCGSGKVAYYVKGTSGTQEVSGPSGISAAEYGMDGADETNGTAAKHTGGSSFNDAGNTADGGMIYVYVCGAVNAPGVYTFPENSRVYEAVNAAGGLRGDADAAALNQAGKLSDGMQITVYTVEETTAGAVNNAAPEAVPGGEGASSDARININTATLEELTTLSGIGGSRAADIIAYRNEHGFFSDIREITNVSGIGDRMFEKIKNDITV
ncbi:MAG TPA: hypothetical protein DCM49_02030 [Lachnospiraceae bacterium]|nr:hypothetical protein [Lachnospiraceae bacterium]